jgi:hypothetical protein
MGAQGGSERCGRCSMTSVVDATADGRGLDEEAWITLEDRQLRRVSPGAWIAPVVRWLDALGWRAIGRR